mgnify:CR=1 FL=1
MKLPNYVYFGEATAEATGTAQMYPAENFVGIDSASSTTAKLYFKPVVNLAANAADGDNNDEVLVTYPDTSVAGNLNFQQICEIIAGAMRGNISGSMTVVADQLNGNYIAPLTGAVTITPGG